jgi:diadenosine tetraphosphate (Ap4A) HIT family hydrolase
MLYSDLLKDIKGCPFCEPITNRIIIKNENCFITYNISPYSKHHLMVIPYRHIRSFIELNEIESKSIDELLRRSVKLLEYLGYDNYTILARNGDTVGNSVRHFHYHIAPSAIVGNLNCKKEDRKILTEEEIDQWMQDFREAEDSINGI